MVCPNAGKDVTVSLFLYSRMDGGRVSPLGSLPDTKKCTRYEQEDKEVPKLSGSLLL